MKIDGPFWKGTPTFEEQHSEEWKRIKDYLESANFAEECRISNPDEYGDRVRFSLLTNGKRHYKDFRGKFLSVGDIRDLEHIFRLS